MQADLAAASSSISLSNIRFSCRFSPRVAKATWTSNLSTKHWILHSTAQIENIITSDEDQSMWEACKQALSAFNFSDEEKDKILGKAFGLVHSPYWGEERKKEVPKFETVNGTLDYLRSLNLSDEDLSKLLKKFPEVLGCNLEEELKANIKILDEQWGIKGKSLRNLLLRNPKVLGYNVDCKGDCMAQCTRCWVRF
ncbi:Transcription termination factor, mitochondrial/chloroplastic [Sesbania bispinosa]|nr:Transcription termination factor, mitochondrial/chloroplastic [Sesbania bispinosa]